MKKFILACCLLSISPLLYAANLEGTYDCKGKEVGTNENFKGKAIIKKTEQTYSLTSSFDDGTSYQGTGIYDEKKHIFALVFINPKKAEETGIVMAEVKNDGSLSSAWTYLNETAVSHSSCIKTTG